MRYTLIIAAVAVVNVVEAGVATEQKECQKTKEVKPLEDPLAQITPGKAVFPCDFGASVPLGKVPTGCAAFEIIVARGTSEPGQLGIIVGDPVVARVQRDLPDVKVRGYPVQYPAGLSGSDTGVKDIIKRLEAQSQACPEEKFALVGYSQGGMVVTSAVPKIPAALQKKVLAIVLYGAGEGTNTGTLQKITLANCAPGDFACPKSGSGEGHVSYNNQGTKWHDRSATYIEEAYKGKPIGYKLMKSPSATTI